MQIVFIIFGVIIVLSFITGVILTMKEKKKNVGQVLTDDPKILFDDCKDGNSDFKQEELVSDNSLVVEAGVTEATPIVSNTDVITTNDSNSKFAFQSLSDVEMQPVPATNIVNTPVSSSSNQSFVSSEEELI